MTSSVATGSTASLKPFRVKDVADALGVDTSTVYAAVRNGELSAYRVGQGRGTIRIPRASLKAYADERGIPAADLGVELGETVAHESGLTFRVVQADGQEARIARDVRNLTMTDGRVWTVGTQVGGYGVGSTIAWRSASEGAEL